MINKKSKEDCRFAYIAEVVSSVLLLITLVTCITVMAQVMSKGYVVIFGYSLFRVETGSMEPTIPTGALLVCKEKEIQEIELNDIICYRSKSQQMLGQVITHRVIKITETVDNKLLLETRGDANTVNDGYYVTEGNLIGEVVWYTGQNNIFANIMNFVSKKVGFFGCIVIPVLVISGFILQGSVKDIRKEMRELLNQELQDIAETVPEDRAEEKLSLNSLTAEEYEALIAELKAEILGELTQSAEKGEDNTEQGA